MRNVLLAGFLVLGISGALSAQEGGPQDEKAIGELARASQNPVAAMNSIPVQFNWTTGGGLGDATQSVTNIQPVLPLTLNKEYNLLSRTIVPIVNLPAGGTDRIKGIADIQQQVYLTPSKPGSVIWGVGPIFSFPTATNPALETGQFALGPAFVVLTMPGRWVLGAVVNNLWRIAGSSSTTAINAFFVQPFINYNLSRGWALSTAPSITANWNAPSGQQWTVPIGLGVSKITRVGSQAMNVSLQYYHNVARPDAAGADLVRMVVTLLFPIRR